MNSYQNKKKKVYSLWKGIYLFHQLFQKPPGIVNTAPPKGMEIVLLSPLSINYNANHA